MPNYELGKIYRVWDDSFKKCYIGSTIDSLSCRMSKHRSAYKKWLTGEGSHVRVYDLFTEYGLNHCNIELLENFPCNTRSELEAREGYHQRLNECINKNQAGRTTKEYNDDHKSKQKEYYETHKEDISNYGKEYRTRNADCILARHKAYWHANKETLLEHKKDYYQSNKDKWNTQAEIMTCECGCEITRGSKSRHLKSDKHKKHMELTTNI